MNTVNSRAEFSFLFLPNRSGKISVSTVVPHWKSASQVNLLRMFMAVSGIATSYKFITPQRRTIPNL